MTPKREIWRGPILGQQRDRLLAEVKARLKQGEARQVIYLTASRPMLDAISRNLLDGQSVVGSFDGLPVYLFNGFIHQLLRTARVQHAGEWRPATLRRDISREDYPARRPLIAQVMRQLAQQGKLPAFGSLATASGCIASVTKLIGEITRAGKTAAEFAQIVEQRIARYQESLPAPDPTGEQTPHPAEQVYGYEQDVARIAQCYAAALEAGGLTDSDVNYLRAIAALDGELDGLACQTPLVQGVTWLIVDGFFDFTPVQGEILRRLIGRIPHVTFNVDDDLDNPQVFAPVRETIEKVRAMGEGFTEIIFHERAGTQPIERFPVADGLDALRLGLFNPAFAPALPPSGSTGPSAPIVLTEAPDLERELRYIAKAIKRYIRLDGLTPSDIAIVVRDKETYGPHLRRIFADEGIAYTLDERLLVTDIPAVRAWLKLLAAAINQPSGTTPDAIPHLPVSRLIDVIKSDYFVLPGSRLSPDDVENVIAFVGDQLHLDTWLARAARLKAYLQAVEGKAAATDDNRPVTPEAIVSDEAVSDEVYAADDDNGTEALRRTTIQPDAITSADLDEVSALLKRLGAMVAAIPTQGEAATLVNALEQTLTALAFESRLATTIRSAVGQPRQLLQATLDLRGLQAVRRAIAATLDAQDIAARGMTAMFGTSTANASPKPPMKLAALQSDILRALDGLTLRVEPETFGAVRILEATTVRGLHFPVIFLPGLVEGGFPIRLPGDWIYPAAERERLKEDGLTLEDISPATLAKEEHYFYQAACRATQALHLSYATIGAEDEELTISSFVSEVMRLSPDIRPGGTHRMVVPKGYDGAPLLEATTAHELTRQAVAVAARRQRGIAEQSLLTPEASSYQLSPSEKLDTIQAYLLKQPWRICTLDQRLAGEQARQGRAWTPFDGWIEAQDLREQLALRFGPQHVFSATALNEYAACPFRFFARRVLNLRPRVTAALDLQAQDRGRLVHDILRDFYRDSIAFEHNVSLEQKLNHLEKVAEATFTHYEHQLPPLNTRLWDIEKRVLVGQLKQFITDELSINLQVVERITEIAFGMRPPKADIHSSEKPLVLTNEQDQEIRLRGQIDRVDIIPIKDENEDKSALIAYDYKLSRGFSLREMLEGRDVQIVIYLEALKSCFPSSGLIIGGGYCSVTKTPRYSHGLYKSKYKELLPSISKNTFLDEPEWKQQLSKVLKHIFDYQQKIQTGSFQITPFQGSKECRFCDFKSICRYENYRIRNKYKDSVKTQKT